MRTFLGLVVGAGILLGTASAVHALPPGIEKKIENGGSLPPGIAKKIAPPAVPEPGAAFLFGTGLLTTASMLRRRIR